VRITIQTPVDSLLQPGGTVGVLMDFRGAHGHLADRKVQPCCLQVMRGQVVGGVLMQVQT
jgi:hypothetical protein